MLDKEHESTLTHYAAEIELAKAEIALLTYPDGTPLQDHTQTALLILLWLRGHHNVNTDASELLHAILAVL
jgi:hypothetical protein